MKKSNKLIVFFLCIFLFPFVVNAEKIDTVRYQYEKSIVGSDMLILDVSDPIHDENQGENNGEQDTDSNPLVTHYCTGLKSTFTLIGHVVFIAKILIPIIIIGFGMIDFFRALIGSKDDEIKKSVKSLIFRCVSGVIIFFLPAFIDLIFSWVNGWQENYENQYKECFQCIWNVGECTK